MLASVTLLAGTNAPNRPLSMSFRQFSTGWGHLLYRRSWIHLLKRRCFERNSASISRRCNSSKINLEMWHRKSNHQTAIVQSKSQTSISGKERVFHIEASDSVVSAELAQQEQTVEGHANQIPLFSGYFACRNPTLILQTSHSQPYEVSLYVNL